jgi:hypothetical protein
VPATAAGDALAGRALNDIGYEVPAPARSAAPFTRAGCFGARVVGQGDPLKAVELHAKTSPRIPKTGCSKLTLRHIDGTKE